MLSKTSGHLLHGSCEKRKLRWHGHINRLTGLAKRILQARYKEGEGKADRKRDGKTIYQNGQDKIE